MDAEPFSHTHKRFSFSEEDVQVEMLGNPLHNAFSLTSSYCASEEKEEQLDNVEVQGKKCCSQIGTAAGNIPEEKSSSFRPTHGGFLLHAKSVTPSSVGVHSRDEETHGRKAEDDDRSIRGNSIEKRCTGLEGDSFFGDAFIDFESGCGSSSSNSSTTGCSTSPLLIGTSSSTRHTTYNPLSTCDIHQHFQQQQNGENRVQQQQQQPQQQPQQQAQLLQQQHQHIDSAEVQQERQQQQQGECEREEQHQEQQQEHEIEEDVARQQREQEQEQLHETSCEEEGSGEEEVEAADVDSTATEGEGDASSQYYTSEDSGDDEGAGQGMGDEEDERYEGVADEESNGGSVAFCDAFAGLESEGLGSRSLRKRRMEEQLQGESQRHQHPLLHAPGNMYTPAAGGGSGAEIRGGAGAGATGTPTIRGKRKHAGVTATEESLNKKMMTSYEMKDKKADEEDDKDKSKKEDDYFGGYFERKGKKAGHHTLEGKSLERHTHSSRRLKRFLAESDHIKRHVEKVHSSPYARPSHNTMYDRLGYLQSGSYSSSKIRGDTGRTSGIRGATGGSNDNLFLWDRNSSMSSSSSSICSSICSSRRDDLHSCCSSSSSSSVIMDRSSATLMVGNGGGKRRNSSRSFGVMVAVDRDLQNYAVDACRKQRQASHAETTSHREQQHLQQLLEMLLIHS